MFKVIVFEQLKMDKQAQKEGGNLNVSQMVTLSGYD